MWQHLRNEVGTFTCLQSPPALSQTLASTGETTHLLTVTLANSRDNASDRAQLDFVMWALCQGTGVPTPYPSSPSLLSCFPQVLSPQDKNKYSQFRKTKSQFIYSPSLKQLQPLYLCFKGCGWPSWVQPHIGRETLTLTDKNSILFLK